MANVKVQPRPTVKASLTGAKKYDHRIKRSNLGEPVSVPKEKD